MIIGSGLIASSFIPYFANNDDICVYAAGVSNSGCTNENEFTRERLRLLDALQSEGAAATFLYFSTCSINDPDTCHTAYVRHKLSMEQLVSAHNNYLIFRLPQVAGKTPNPHTLLNYLYARISRSESFTAWKNAKRNIIDIEDIVAVVRMIVAGRAGRCLTFNVANPVNYSIMDIVKAMESVLRKKAVYETSGRGQEYVIDTHETMPWFDRAGVSFDDLYLLRTIGKYYGRK